MAPSSLRRGVVAMVLCTMIGGTGAVAALMDETTTLYSAFQKAFYLGEEDAVWIRPGLKLEIQDVRIGANRKPTVQFRITDDRGQALDRSGNTTPGVVSTSFIMAYIPQDKDQYVSYTTRVVTSPITKVTETQATGDSGGTYTSMGDGVYVYTFAKTLPEDYDSSTTHTLGMYSTRDLREWNLSRYVANELKSFVPDGRPVEKVRAVTATETCNSCHNPLAAHGGSRQKVELCVMCHTPQTKDPDTGETVDMKVMAHKIHMGHNLPSVLAGKPYQIIGNSQSMHDFSTVAFPRDIQSCDTCHKDASQAANWMLKPSRATCGSCHDDVNFATGEKHKAGAQKDDSDCASCHQPQGEFEFDASISGAHVAPYRSTSLVRPKFEIVRVMNTGPGQKPKVHFKVTDKDGATLEPSKMARLSLVLAGPSTSYKWYVSESAAAATPVEGTDHFEYAFKAALPSDATGSYSVGVEGYVNTTLAAGTSRELLFRDTGDNTVKFFAVTGSVTPRRKVVETAKCNACHERLQLHGGQRNDVQQCIACHNPTNTDAARRGTGDLPAQGIDFKVLIHRIHSGEELQSDFTVFGYGNRAFNFNEVRFPGDRRDCLQCHAPGTYTLPLAKGIDETKDPRFLWSPILPASAACVGCHDSTEAASHIYINTSTFGESCAVCHKEGAEFAVTKAHAR